MSLLILIAIILIIVFISCFVVVKKDEDKKQALEKAYQEATVTCGVKLISVGPEKIKTIKIFREFTQWDLTLALEKISLPLPAVIIWKMPQQLALQLQEELHKYDTIVELF